MQLPPHIHKHPMLMYYISVRAQVKNLIVLYGIKPYGKVMDQINAISDLPSHHKKLIQVILDTQLTKFINAIEKIAQDVIIEFSYNADILPSILANIRQQYYVLIEKKLVNEELTHYIQDAVKVEQLQSLLYDSLLRIVDMFTKISNNYGYFKPNSFAHFDPQIFTFFDELITQLSPIADITTAT